MNMIDIKTNEAAIFSLYLNTRLMYGDKRYIEIIFLTVHLLSIPKLTKSEEIKSFEQSRE